MEFIKVSPAQWRERLLTPKERSSANSAKAASRDIARQLLRRFAASPLEPYVWGGAHSHAHVTRREGDGSGGTMKKRNRMNTDAAEALLIGYYGVLERESGSGGLSLGNTAAVAAAGVSCPVERYTNGNICR